MGQNLRIFTKIASKNLIQPKNTYYGHLKGFFRKNPTSEAIELLPKALIIFFTVLKRFRWVRTGWNM